MTGLHTVERHYDVTNAMALAILGIVDLAAGIERALSVPSDRLGQHDSSTNAVREPDEPREPGDLELALLGLITLGRRLGDVGADSTESGTADSDDTDERAPRSDTWSSGDVLR